MLEKAENAKKCWEMLEILQNARMQETLKMLENTRNACGTMIWD